MSAKTELIIRKAEKRDHDGMWQIIEPIIKAGDTYVFDPSTTRTEMLKYWTDESKFTYVAELDGEVLGTFIITKNQPGLGSHVANASYMVHPKSHGKGVGKQMAEYSLHEAKSLGFKSMQFNIVVKSNEGAVALWKKLGFKIVGEVPDVFKHCQLGYVNAFIMYKDLTG